MCVFLGVGGGQSDWEVVECNLLPCVLQATTVEDLSMPWVLTKSNLVKQPVTLLDLCYGKTNNLNLQQVVSQSSSSNTVLVTGYGEMKVGWKGHCTDISWNVISTVVPHLSLSMYFTSMGVILIAESGQCQCCSDGHCTE